MKAQKFLVKYIACFVMKPGAGFEVHHYDFQIDTGKLT